MHQFSARNNTIWRKSMRQERDVGIDTESNQQCFQHINFNTNISIVNNTFGWYSTNLSTKKPSTKMPKTSYFIF